MTPPQPAPHAAGGACAGDIDALRDALTAAGERDVATVETHISWLLLAGERVWKFKKPVRLPFVDFTTLAQRRHCCEEELRLNRRVAPDLYLGLRALWRDARGRLGFTAPRPGQEADEWAVEMRRFADDALLRTQVLRGAIDGAAMQQLGERLAQFHAAPAGTSPPEARYGSPALIRSEVRALFPPLQDSPWAGRLPQWQAWVDAQADALEPVWRQRRAQGFVREGHGDLHLGNLVVLGASHAPVAESGGHPPREVGRQRTAAADLQPATPRSGRGPAGTIVPFDCIEFQPAMRWIDTVNDVGFLTMDLHAHGRADLAAWLMDGWLAHGGDYAGLAVWRFYEVYRALVRAMVAQLGQDAEAGARYAGLLDRWTAPARRPPRLFITCGASGSGKSTVAAALMERTGAVRIRSDVERKRLFGLAALDDSQQAGLDIYTAEATERTFARLAELARGALRAGWPVIVDAAFLRRSQRAAFITLAGQEQARLTILACQADDEVLRQRIARRRATQRDASEATVELVAQQLQWQDPFTDSERPLVCAIDTQRPDWREALDRLADTP